MAQAGNVSFMDWANWTLNDTYAIDPNNQLTLNHINLTQSLAEVQDLFSRLTANPGNRDLITQYLGARRNLVEKTETLIQKSVSEINALQNVAIHARIIAACHSITNILNETCPLPPTDVQQQQQQPQALPGQPIPGSINYISQDTVKIPPFHGEPKDDKFTINQFIRAIEQAADNGRWTNDTIIKQTAHSLRGRALLWFDWAKKFSVQEVATWEALKQAMKNAFTIGDTHPQHRLQPFKIRLPDEHPMRVREKCELVADEYTTIYHHHTTVDACVDHFRADIAKVSYIMAVSDAVRAEFYRQDKIEEPLAT